MLDFLPNKRMVSFILSVFLVLSAVTFPAFAANTEITESNTYVLNRDGNGEPLYRYQSPCMIGYDFNNQYGGNGKASFYGLAYRKYFLVETKAPDGYNPMGETFEK